MSMKRINQSLQQIYGLPCWDVKNVHGSILRFEFGQPNLYIREPHASSSVSPRVREWASRRNVLPVGESRLCIDCCDWFVTVDGKPVADSTNPRKIKSAIKVLGGQILEKVTTSDFGKTWEFDFDLGATLITSPYDRKSEQWSLSLSENKVLSIRADNKYSYCSATKELGKEKWRAIFS